MRLAQWIASFRALHEKARGPDLSPDERKTYLLAREELARALLAAQRVTAKPGQSPRLAVRVSRALQADLDLPSEKEMIRAMTLDLSLGGFGTILAKAPAPSEKVRFALRLPGGDRVDGNARVVGVLPSAGSVRVSFAFEELKPEHAEKLEMLIFDTVLQHLKEAEPKKPPT